jgi:hypothetical protein
MKSGDGLNLSGNAYANIFIRQVISDRWMKIVHLEIGARNELKIYYQGDSWESFSVKNRAAGDELMQSIKENPEVAISRGLVPEESDFGNNGLSYLGFSALEVPSRGIEADAVFTLGLDFADKTLSGWSPSTVEEITKVSYFLLNAPFQLGYFGNFKLILKSLTSKFDEICDGKNEDFVALLAGTMGAAFGRVDAYLARGQRPPSFRVSAHGDLRHLSSVPEFDGYDYPSIRTAQFLARMGLRLMSQIESGYSGYPSTRFRLNVIASADFWHEEPYWGSPEKYLQHQLLVTAVVYGKDELVKRDRSSRKVLLDSAAKRHSLIVSQSFVDNLNENELENYRRLISKIHGANSAVVHYCLAMSKVIPGSEFDWNEKTVEILSNSESKQVRSAVWSAVLERPSLLHSARNNIFQEFLPTLKDAELDAVFEVFRSAPGRYEYVVREWANSILGRKLSKTELRLACEFLKSSWRRRDEDQRLFLQVASLTDLEPFEEWQEHFGVSEYFLEANLGFFGIEPTSEFPQGLLDVVNPNRRELILAIAKQIAAALSWAYEDERERALLAMHDSTKPGVSNIFWCIVTQGLLSSEKTNSVLTKLNETDPTATGYLNGLQYSFEMNDTQGLLVLLEILAGDDESSFWRKNAVGAEKAFRSWPGFAEFVWENLSNLHPSHIEHISNFTWLPIEIYELLRPNAFAKMSLVQAGFLAALIAMDKSLLADSKFVRAMLTAPNSLLNESALTFVSDNDCFDIYWLHMLESKLPIPQSAAQSYLHSQVDQPDFAEKLLMAIDSNSATARQIAMNILESIPSISMLQQVVSKLVESRNSDTWALVANNLQLLDNSEGLNEFTKTVLLSKRQGRTVKEKIKVSVERFVDDIAFAVEIDTLLRLAQGSNNKDREWALRQLALAPQPIEGVSVERTWKAVKNV